MLQTGEIIVIVLLALVILGPTRLPEMARKAGRWTNELRNAAREITRGLESEVAQIQDVAKELKAPLDELKAPLDEVKKPLTEIRDEMSGFAPMGHVWKGPKPVSGPTPEDAMRDLEELNEMVSDAGPEGTVTEDAPEPETPSDSGNEPRE